MIEEKSEKPSTLHFNLPVSGRFATYTERTPILDSTLFVGRNYNDFVFGGKNIRLVKFAVRTVKGEDVRIRKNFSESMIEIDYWIAPYIEMDYKGKYYSISVQVDDFAPQYTIRRIDFVTMELLEFTK